MTAKSFAVLDLNVSEGVDTRPSPDKRGRRGCADGL